MDGAGLGVDRRRDEVQIEASGLIARLIFSSIGVVDFTYGKRTERYRVMALGGALMAYSYFTPSAAWTWVAGAGLTCAIFYLRD